MNQKLGRRRRRTLANQASGTREAQRIDLAQAVGEEPWTLGSLRTENFGFVETRLRKRGIAAPIVIPEMVEEDNRPVLLPFEKWTRICIDSVKTELSVKADIEHCFVQSWTPNAFASRTPIGAYYIALYMGSLEIGKALAKVLQDQNVRDYLSIGPCIARKRPDVDPDFSLLLGTSFQWLVYHELGHIINGHLHLRLAGTNDAFEAVELMFASDRLDNNITMHTLEMDADAFAAQRVVFPLLQLPREAIPNCAMLESPERKLKAFYVAMYTMMRTFDNGAWKLADLYRYTHPPGMIRAVSLGSWGFAFAEKLTLDLPPEKWIEFSSGAARVVEGALQKEKNPFILSELSGFFPDGFTAYTKRKLARWAKIRPELEPHVLGGRLAAPQEDPA